MTQTAALDIFSAIGNPRRRQILSLLANKEYGVVELADKLGISQPSASEQLGSLKRAGLVTSSAKGRRRIYHLDTAPLGEVASWVIEINTFWDERFARLSQLVEELDKEER